MELITTEVIQSMIVSLPNFAGFLLLSIVLWNINGRLLALLEKELDDCREVRERDQIVALTPRQPVQSGGD